VGTMITASLGAFRWRGWLLLGGAVVFRRVAGALRAVARLPYVCALLALCGLANSIYMTTANTTIQARVPGETAAAGDGHLQPHLEHDAGRRDGQRDRRQFRRRAGRRCDSEGRSWPAFAMLVR